VFRFHRITIAVLTVILLSLSRTTRAQPVTAPTAPPTTPTTKVEPAPSATAPTPKPTATKREKEVPAEAKASPAPDETSLTANVRAPDLNFRFPFVLQTQGRFFLAGHGTDTFLIRRARPALLLELFERVEAYIHVELSSSTLVLLDASGTWSFGDALEIRVGKGKVPLGLEQLQSTGAVTFGELALPAELLPNRDVGVQVQGKIGAGTLSYQVGVYNGTPAGGTGDLDDNNSKDFVGRLFVRPLLSTRVRSLEGLGLGVAGAIGRQSNALPSYEPFSRQTFFQYVKADTTAGTPGATAKGERRIFVPQGHYYAGPVGLLAEYAWTRQNVTTGISTALVAADAWQVSASEVIGGKPTYEGVKVDHPFSLQRGTLGALEFAARYSALRVHDAAFRYGLAKPKSSADRAIEWTVGLGWHFAYLVSFKLEVSRTRFGRHDAPAQRRDETILLGQFQIAVI
jgi:phosphate-selective porin OprO and OprP